ncbi:hypothetical protein Acsp03_00850 [Actinomadura sp. NBRC 104412]|uniref:formate dehydrogenase subunit delta n=1 Tax=Actinomadura sp. NBRC 104412 TaxID=3032203 RepID=UPI0024A033B3|nr:formate dehydrogenase subunit delta [Actinomadura sp. NBRC 104412]GLZ02618.1 hypothetical protein Acsp03_00850 [Actinomadura sp. NBRC 104412]
MNTGAAQEPPVRTMNDVLPSQIRLANDIAVQFERRPPDEAAAAIAEHIRMFWEPSMRADLIARATDHADDLHPLALAAVRVLTASQKAGSSG